MVVRRKGSGPKRLTSLLCAAVLFAFLFIFFSQVHPLAMQGGGHWGYRFYWLPLLYARMRSASRRISLI